MKASLHTRVFTPLTVLVTIETEEEWKALETIVLEVTRSDISKVHSPMVRNVLLTLAEDVYAAGRKG